MRACVGVRGWVGGCLGVCEVVVCHTLVVCYTLLTLTRVAFAHCSTAFITDITLRKQQIATDALLLNLLPKHIADELKGNHVSSGRPVCVCLWLHVLTLTQEWRERT